MKKPLVSILMNCYNGEKYLNKSLDSILSQSLNDWELIFWDNQSTDNSASIFKKYKDKRFKYYYSKVHTGLGKARESAYAKLTGKYIAILDTDDIWEPKKLEKQIQFFDDSKVGIVVSNTKIFNEQRSINLLDKNFNPPLWSFKTLLENYFISLETLVMKKSSIDKLKKNFDGKYNLIADFDLVIRLSKEVKMRYCPEVLSGWRIHESNDTFKNPKMFVYEKEVWFAEQIKNGLFKSNEKEKDTFINNLSRQKALYKLIDYKRMQSLKIFINLKTKTIKDYILILLTLIPFSPILIRLILTKRSKFGL
tara:strand:+ start:5548 stop:6471 length:924 start_codon:yes stop_codon:yes gene_type:complete